MRRRIHQPCRVQADDGAHEDSPQQKRQPADRQQDQAQDNHWNVMIFGDPDMKLVFCQIRHITRQRCSVVMHGFPGQNPAHVRPPLTVDRRVRIAFVIGKLMMNAMRGYPEDWSAFKSQSCAGCEEIFDPLRSSVTAMREQPMVAHTNAQASRNPPEEHRHQKSFPGKEEECGNRPHMKQAHEGCGYPVDFVIGGWFAVKCFEFHCGPCIRCGCSRTRLAGTVGALCNSSVISRQDWHYGSTHTVPSRTKA